jgi:hypothetical protein
MICGRLAFNNYQKAENDRISMCGETDLSTLLTTMSPVLKSEEYVFCSLEQSSYGDFPQLRPLAAISEKEGLTLVIPRTMADKYAYNYQSVFSSITLNVHSSLDAVGLTAAIATELAKHQISANIIAGYYHDHIFVQKEFATKAVAALQALSEFHCIADRNKPEQRT